MWDFKAKSKLFKNTHLRVKENKNKYESKKQQRRNDPRHK